MKEEKEAQAPANAAQPETPAAEEAKPKAPADPLAELQQKLEAETKKAAEAQDKLVRTLAEWDNSRKRLAKEKEDAIRFANEGLLEGLLPIVDNFELGMQAAANAQDAKAIVVGLQMVLGQIQNFLRESGLEPIDAVGQPFDPHKHEAVSHQPSDKPEGTVLSQSRKGYALKGKLLRPATVVVSQGKEEKPDKAAKAGK